MNGLQPGTSQDSSLNRPAREEATTESPASHNWGSSGNTLGSNPYGSKSAIANRLASAKKKAEQQRDRSPTPDYGVDDDDVIVIDSD